jgi:hypothetical protein
MREWNVYPLNFPSNICAHNRGCDGCVRVSPEPNVCSVGCISELISTVMIEVSVVLHGSKSLEVTTFRNAYCKKGK